MKVKQRKFWGKAKRFLAGTACASVFVCGSNLFLLPASARDLISIFQRSGDEIIDRVLSKLQAAEADADPEQSAGLTEDEINHICDKVKPYIQRDPTLIETPKGTPALIVGDVHGELRSVAYAIEYFGEELNTEEHMVFLGDYVDRGPRSIECAVMLFLLKLRFPDQVWLLRGNHEVYRMNAYCVEEYATLKSNCIDAFGEAVGHSVCCKINEVFDVLPLAAVIGGDTLCVHGGIPKGLRSLQEIKNIARPLFDTKSNPIAVQLLWNDPAPDSDADDFEESDRGVGYCFSWNVFSKFKNEFGIAQLIRGHEVAGPAGFFISFAGYKSCVTVFSAPGYCDNPNIGGAFIYMNADGKFETHMIDSDFVLAAPAA